ncbi:phosphotransferase [uncultured Deinococcus sp.]|uniref:phosphotransferase enzyme family protein n=1 Tax=uncultured Deinococcus sp. TaxID=158789 RepID=UPI0025880D4C|nr:phosphotransferase [uncultured Deinococcus sp.]
MNAAGPTCADLDRFWDLGGVTALTALGGGSINGAWRVEAGTGHFHLRVYRSPDRARAERELAAVAVAVAAGVPTPAPRPARAGGVLARLEAGWAALFPALDGAPVPRAALTADHAGGLGHLLAEVHTRLPRQVPFEVPGLHQRPVGEILTRLERIEAAILAWPEPGEVDAWALERTRQRLAHLRASPPADHAPTFPARFLHGDFHDGNVFFLNGTPHALIDWEHPRLAPRAWEIVRCLHLSLRLHPVLGQAFLDGYRARLPLSTPELADGAALYATLQERNVWTYESIYLEGNPGPRQFVRPPPHVPFVRDWAASGLGMGH